MDPHPWDQAQRSAREARRQARAERREMWRARCAENGGGFGGMVFGLMVVALGVLFLLNNLRIIYIADVWQFWPVLLIAWGVSKVVTLRSAHSTLWGLLLTGIGGLFLAQNLQIVDGDVWRYIWPGLIIAWGLSMLASQLDARDQPPPAATTPGASAPPSNVPPSNNTRVYIDVLFSGDQRRIVSQDFEGGRCSAVFGGIELDLRGAGTKLPDMRIHADAVFGGVDIRIPESWIAEVRGTGVFGGYVDKTVHVPPTDGSPAPRLIVKGGAVFGGVNVRN